MVRRVTPQERFNEKVVDVDFGCRIWCGSRIGNRGYGQAWFNGRVQQAHRVAWQLAGREIPEGLMVLHRCDVRACVNVDHLFVGTALENSIDMTKKARGVAKLSFEQVAEIRSSRETLTTLAKKFGVSVASVGNARTGVTFRWLGEAA